MLWYNPHNDAPKIVFRHELSIFQLLNFNFLAGMSTRNLFQICSLQVIVFYQLQKITYSYKQLVNAHFK